MKTAISIPDDVFEAAEATARRVGMSRSQLYVEAIRLFLAVNADRGVTERLNEVCDAVRSEVDPVLLRMQIASVAPEEW